MSDNQQHNLSELIVALQALRNEKGDVVLSPELMTLLKEDCITPCSLSTLQPKAAEAMQLTYEAIGEACPAKSSGLRPTGTTERLHEAVCPARQMPPSDLWSPPPATPPPPKSRPAAGLA